MGLPSSGITNPLAQGNQPTNQPHIYITPTGSPLLKAFLTLPANIMVGGTPISFSYGKYMHVSQIPPLLVYNKAYTSAILESSSILFLLV